jgi:hypothetical protein
MSDDVIRPSHYRKDSIEAIDVIEAWDLNFSLGNTVKYICRNGLKHQEDYVTDLRKAAWYLNREISRLEKLCLLDGERPASSQLLNESPQTSFQFQARE